MTERVRVILDCEWGDLQHALDMVVEAKPTFDRHPNRPGWGWHFSRLGKTSLFVRRTKHGFSATAAGHPAQVGRHPKGQDAEERLGAEHEHAVGEADAPTLIQDPPS